MEILVDLMQRKNSFLEKFYTINEAELLNFSAGDFENLEAFYQCRENILRLIARLDEQIEISLKSVELKSVTPEIRSRVQECLDRKDDWAKKIVDSDLRIISEIEKKKSGIITELRSVQNGKMLHKAYNSAIARGRQKVNEKV